MPRKRPGQDTVRLVFVSNNRAVESDAGTQRTQDASLCFATSECRLRFRLWHDVHRSRVHVRPHKLSSTTAPKTRNCANETKVCTDVSTSTRGVAGYAPLTIASYVRYRKTSASSHLFIMDSAMNFRVFSSLLDLLCMAISYNADVDYPMQ